VASYPTGGMARSPATAVMQAKPQHPRKRMSESA
jgi:hypothetical protein